MEQKFSKSWIKSKNPNKQRKFVANAPKHIKQKCLHSNLSKELRGQYNRRSFRLRKDDKVRVLRGNHKGKKGKIEKIFLNEAKVHIAGIEFNKKDGSKSFYPIHASNLVIEELNLNDKKRKNSLTKAVTKKQTDTKKKN